ncbi:hypothetical protein [Thermithiobacillus plumbiphilus]|uniref:Secreted protein n=1 Tax=Thermithiobacillus plumbiphilus TaxID=1729899 RepID=A0ABU9DER9_9PROT
MSSRQLRHLSPIVLGLWLLALVLTSFQPCAVAAESLATAPQAAKAVHHDAREDHCPGASEQYGKGKCCDHKHYTHCNQPEVVKHDQAVNLDFQAQAHFLPASAILLTSAENATRRRMSPYHPPADLPRLLAATRLLI